MKLKTRLLTILTTVLMVFSMLPIGAGVAYANVPDKTKPEIDLSSVSVSLPEGKTSVISGEKVKFAVKVKNEVNHVEFSIASTKSRQVRTVLLDYNQNSSRWEGEYTITENDKSEEWCIRNIYAEAGSYNGTVVSNNAYWLGYDAGTDVETDLSAHNFTVANSCKVTFDTFGKSKVDPQYVVPGGKVTLPNPESMSEESFHFNGWYQDEAMTKAFKTNDPVNEDMTLFANWTVVGGIGTYDVSKGVSASGGQYTNDYNKAYGHEDYQTSSCFVMNEKLNSTFTVKAFPDKDYEFKGWFEGKMEFNYPDGEGNNGWAVIPKDLNDPSTLLSTDPEYTFPLNRSIYVCAVFKKSNDDQPDQVTPPTVSDETKPEIDLSSVSVSLPEGKTSVITGDKVKLAVKAAENKKLDYVEISLASTKSRQVRKVVLDYNQNSDRWEGEYTITENDKSEEWCIRDIYDEAGAEYGSFVFNNAYWLDYEVGPGEDLSAHNFTVAKTCKVTFDTFGGSKIDPQYVVPGGKAALPMPEPTKEEGFRCDGWYQDEALTKEFSITNDPVNEDITLFAKWSIVGGLSPYDASTGITGAGGQYTIAMKEGFKSDQTYSTYTLYEAPNSIFTLKAYPDKDYEFKGWFEGKMVWDNPNGQGVIPKNLKDASTLLSKDTEYTFTYDHSVYICAVFAKTDDEMGDEQPEQKITPTVTLSATSYTWDDQEKKPEVTVKDGEKTLDASCYTVEYKNNKSVGKASAIVTLKGSCSGSATAYFKINPKGTGLKTPVKGSKAVTVKWKQQAAKMSSSRVSGYQIQLATDSKFTKGKKTVNVSGYSKVSKKVGGLKGNRKYYIRIRTYKTIEGKKYYSSWSKTKTVTTKK